MDTSAYRRIVCLCRPASSGAALHQSALLAQAGRTPLDAVSLDRSALIDLATRCFAGAGRRAREAWLTRTLASLESVAARERRNGSDVVAEVLWAAPRVRAWNSAVQTRRADLVVREAGALGRRDQFGAVVAGELARGSGAPLYLPDERQRRLPKRVIALLPAGDHTPASGADGRLMPAARRFADACGAELHVALIGSDRDDRMHGRSLLAACASAGDVARQHCHHRDGEPAAAVAVLCHSLPGSALAIAAAAPAALFEAAALHAHGLLLVPAPPS